ncbi:MAG: alanine racemase [Desulfovibrionaceae bacterium]|nr:alanine racemase [Desulfovibrionaceae bacterium]
MSCLFTQAKCHVDLAAVRRNFARCGKPENLMPVVKSDAYGHGLLQVAHCLALAGATRFAVGYCDEGRLMREHGHTERILPLMPPISDDEWSLVRKYSLTPLVCSFEELERARTVGTEADPLPVAIKLETGMHRLGFRQETIPALIDRLKSSPTLKPAMCVSHCSCADMPEKQPHTAAQICLFSEMAGTLLSAFPDIERSLFNSAGTLETEFRCNICDIARPGIILYGGNPFAGTQQERLGSQLEWAMSLSSVVLQVTELRKGEAVSYGQTYVAQKDMRLAVVGAGYANGVPRALSNNLSALIRGRRVHEVGRVCMNMMMFDVTDMPEVRAGDTVWLWGGDALPGESPVTPQEWADALGTISYELLCIVGSINARVYTS